MQPFHLLLLAVLLLAIAEDSEASAWRKVKCFFNRRSRRCRKPSKPAPKVSRIILVPGFFGSQLRATDITDKGEVENGQTSISAYGLLVQPMTNFQTPENLLVTPYQFGKTDGVECIIENLSDKTGEACLAPSPLKDTVDFFASKPDFQRDVDIRGAPYNYRYGPDGLERDGFFQNLKSLIEETYNGRGVTIMGHSMGGLLSLHFLNNIVDQKWKDKYVESFIALGTGFGGAVKAARVMISGDSKKILSYVDINPKLTGIAGKLLRRVTSTIMQTWPGLFYNLPKPQVFKDQSVIVSRKKAYTAGQLSTLFKKLKIPVPPNFDSLQTAALTNPGVPTYCMYGLKGPKSTPAKVTYRYKKRSRKIKSTKITEGEGDGTVPLISLDACKAFGLTSDSEANIRNFPGAGHTGIVKNEEMLQMVYEMVKARK